MKMYKKNFRNIYEPNHNEQLDKRSDNIKINYKLLN